MKEGSLKPDRSARGIRIADSPLILIRGEELGSLSDPPVGQVLDFFVYMLVFQILILHFSLCNLYSKLYGASSLKRIISESL